LIGSFALGPLLAEIFLGKIGNWNESSIGAVNPGIGLPDRPIIVSYRQDGSGTTYTFTDYLSKVSSDWEKGPGRGMLVQWPVGVHAAGNEGVAAAVKNDAGAIGYVEVTYAIGEDLPFAQIQIARAIG
jgi:phosphate transport system substrate-binding protein